jgi:hypothetical protein
MRPQRRISLTHAVRFALARFVCSPARPRVADLDRVAQATAIGNAPLWAVEWAISTNFDSAVQIRHDWADAQKMAYSQGAGWIVRVQSFSL